MNENGRPSEPLPVSNDLATFALYGLNVRSEIELAGRRVSTSDWDVEFSLARPNQPFPFVPSETTLEYSRSAAGIELHCADGWNCLRYAGVAEFFFAADRVIAFVGPDTSQALLSALLQGPVSAVLLEQRGVVCLHASAVQIDGHVVALLGDSGAGKSSLAASLVARGFPLVTDDILPLRIVDDSCLAYPGYAQIKLSDRMVRQLGLPESFVPDLDKHVQPVAQDWGSFAQHPAPLLAVYVLQRASHQASHTTIDDLAPSDRFVELLRSSFCSRVIGSLGLEASRFFRLGRIADRVAVRQLRVANGVKHLDEVCQRVVADAQRLAIVCSA